MHDDVRGLQKYCEFEAKNFVDLQKIVWEYGIKDKSVKKMSAIILGVRISKTQQLSNWEAVELSDSQQLYAATDAWICREMYKLLMKSEKRPLKPEEMAPPHQEAKQPAEEKKNEEAKQPEKKKTRSRKRRDWRRKRYYRNRRNKSKDNGKDNTEKGREESLKRFHPWVFSGAIAQIVGEPAEGDVVEVYGQDGKFLAAGHYQIGSIAVRVLSFESGVINADYWKLMLSRALAVRVATGLADSDTTNCYRLVHGEGDNLPGLIIDWYDGVCVMQAHSAGMFRAKSRLHRHWWKSTAIN